MVKVTLQFTRNSHDGHANIAGIGYRVAQKGEACHEWSRNYDVPLNKVKNQSLFTFDDGVYTLHIDSSSSWAFRNGNRVCVDVGFVTTAGNAYKSSRRWRDFQMPSGAATSRPTPVGDAEAAADAMLFNFTVDPYDWTRSVGYRIARTGDAGASWTVGYGPIKPGQELNGAAVSVNDNVWTLSVPVRDDETMKPSTKYCVDIWPAKSDDAAPKGARWKFTTGPQ